MGKGGCGVLAVAGAQRAVARPWGRAVLRAVPAGASPARARTRGRLGSADVSGRCPRALCGHVAAAAPSSGVGGGLLDHCREKTLIASVGVSSLGGCWAPGYPCGVGNGGLGHPPPLAPNRVPPSRGKRCGRRRSHVWGRGPVPPTPSWHLSPRNTRSPPHPPFGVTVAGQTGSSL